MTVVGRIKNRDMLIPDEVNERLPSIKNGLVVHFPFDGTAKAIGDRNILNYSTWIIGTNGTQAGFNQNGDGNSIIEGEDPWGNKTAVWQSLNNDAASDADGGFYTSTFAIDNTKLYRFSVWCKRNALTSGRFYFGCYGYGTTNGVYRNDDGITLDGNPYFWYSGANGEGLIAGEWMLVVGHIFPYSNTSTAMHANSGIYRCNGVKVSNIYDDYRWHSASATSCHRSYLFYSTDPTTQQLWCYPRVDLCDGSEPTIQDLISGFNKDGGTINPITNSNTTLTPDGIAVEDATTNICTYTKFTDGWYSNLTVTEVVDANLNGIAVKALGLKYSGSGDNHTYYSFTGAVSTTYTVSFWVKSKLGTSMLYNCFLQEQGASWRGFGSNFNGTNGTVSREWTKVILTGTTPADCYSIIRVIIRPPDNTNDEFYYTQPMIEQRGFATSFVAGSRACSSPLSISCPIGTGDFTFVCKIKPDFNTIGNLSKALFEFTNGATLGLEFMQGWGTDYYIGTETNWSTVSLGGLPYSQGELLTVVVTRTGTTISWMMFDSNGAQVLGYSGTNSAWALNVQRVTLGRFAVGQNTWLLGNSVYRDMLVYNRILTSDEIKQLTSGTPSFNKIGAITVRDIIERPMGIPSDAYYFPLGSDAKDEQKIVSPSSEANIVYEDGGVWVGTAVTNLIANPSCGFAWPTFNGTYTYSRIAPTFPGNYMKLTRNYPSDTSNDCFYQFGNYTAGLPSGAAAGSVVSFSFDVWKPKNLYAWQAAIIAFDNDGVGWDTTGSYMNGDAIALQSEKWTRMKVTKTLRTGAIHMMFRAALASSTDGDYMLIRNAQIEVKAFNSPFANGARAATDLEYNFNSSIGLDWNGSWTICYWKKPVGTATSLLTGYNIESLGSNSNTVGGGYVWWGKDNASNTIPYSTNGTFDPAVYFNNWQFIVVKKNGTAFSIDTYLSNGVKCTRSNAFGTVASNYYVTPYGYDFKLGGWDNNSICNNYFKDLIVAKRALTDTEIEQIRNGQARRFNNGALHIGNQIKEGVTL